MSTIPIQYYFSEFPTIDNLQRIGEHIHQPHHKCPPNKSMFLLPSQSTFSETNNSLAAHGGAASDGRLIDSIKMKKIGYNLLLQHNPF